MVANFGFKSGTRIIELLASFDSEVREWGCGTNDANFGIGTLAKFYCSNIDTNL